MDLQLRDRVYIVTGGTRGLGRATAAELVADGARVLLTGRTEDGVAAAVADLAPVADQGGGAVRGTAADNGDPQTPARLVAEAEAAWGRLDGALISVGGPPAGPATAMTDEQWSGAFETVFLGGVRLAREIGTRLGRGGALAMVLSSSVRQPVAGLAISNGLRPGLAMVAKTLADELGPAGIRVNTLLPGRIGTDRVAELDAATGDADAARAAAIGQIPLGRYGEPEEFGRAAAFLLSPAASFLSGVALPVDGGMTRSL
ncbi:SDR family oxidoreductase [Nocardioides sambongensis]|uniref:SDR family oxidoreductase n=1 Tax=Nocardioides sambongensis TaxID=2589074 RepID=UPI0011298D4A|nr:SDR family oxidoreductase [Nocardioides sambongensis]